MDCVQNASPVALLRFFFTKMRFLIQQPDSSDKFTALKWPECADVVSHPVFTEANMDVSMCFFFFSCICNNIVICKKKIQIDI